MSGGLLDSISSRSMPVPRCLVHTVSQSAVNRHHTYQRRRICSQSSSRERRMRVLIGDSSSYALDPLHQHHYHQHKHQQQCVIRRYESSSSLSADHHSEDVSLKAVTILLEFSDNLRRKRNSIRRLDDCLSQMSRSFGKRSYSSVGSPIIMWDSEERYAVDSELARTRTFNRILSDLRRIIHYDGDSNGTTLVSILSLLCDQLFGSQKRPFHTIVADNGSVQVWLRNIIDVFADRGDSESMRVLCEYSGIAIDDHLIALFMNADKIQFCRRLPRIDHNPDRYLPLSLRNDDSSSILEMNQTWFSRQRSRAGICEANRKARFERFLNHYYHHNTAELHHSGDPDSKKNHVKVAPSLLIEAYQCQSEAYGCDVSRFMKHCSLPSSKIVFQSDDEVVAQKNVSDDEMSSNKNHNTNTHLSLNRYSMMKLVDYHCESALACTKDLTNLLRSTLKETHCNSDVNYQWKLKEIDKLGLFVRLHLKYGLIESVSRYIRTAKHKKYDVRWMQNDWMIEKVMKDTLLSGPVYQCLSVIKQWKRAQQSSSLKHDSIMFQSDNDDHRSDLAARVLKYHYSQKKGLLSSLVVSGSEKKNDCSKDHQSTHKTAFDDGFHLDLVWDQFIQKTLPLLAQSSSSHPNLAMYLSEIDSESLELFSSSFMNACLKNNDVNMARKLWNFCEVNCITLDSRTRELYDSLLIRDLRRESESSSQSEVSLSNEIDHHNHKFEDSLKLNMQSNPNHENEDGFHAMIPPVFSSKEEGLLATLKSNLYLPNEMKNPFLVSVAELSMDSIWVYGDWMRLLEENSRRFEGTIVEELYDSVKELLQRSTLVRAKSETDKRLMIGSDANTKENDKIWPLNSNEEKSTMMTLSNPSYTRVSFLSDMSRVISLLKQVKMNNESLTIKDGGFFIDCCSLLLFRAFIESGVNLRNYPNLAADLLSLNKEAKLVKDTNSDDDNNVNAMVLHGLTIGDLQSLWPMNPSQQFMNDSFAIITDVSRHGKCVELITLNDDGDSKEEETTKTTTTIIKKKKNNDDEMRLQICQSIVDGLGLFWSSKSASDRRCYQNNIATKDDNEMKDLEHDSDHSKRVSRYLYTTPFMYRITVLRLFDYFKEYAASQIHDGIPMARLDRKVYRKIMSDGSSDASSASNSNFNEIYEYWQRTLNENIHHHHSYYSKKKKSPSHLITSLQESSFMLDFGKDTTVLGRCDDCMNGLVWRLFTMDNQFVWDRKMRTDSNVVDFCLKTLFSSLNHLLCVSFDVMNVSMDINNDDDEIYKKIIEIELEAFVMKHVLMANHLITPLNQMTNENLMSSDQPNINLFAGDSLKESLFALQSLHRTMKNNYFKSWIRSGLCEATISATERKNPSVLAWFVSPKELSQMLQNGEYNDPKIMEIRYRMVQRQIPVFSSMLHRILMCYVSYAKKYLSNARVNQAGHNNNNSIKELLMFLQHFGQFLNECISTHNYTLSIRERSSINRMLQECVLKDIRNGSFSSLGSSSYTAVYREFIDIIQSDPDLMVFREFLTDEVITNDEDTTTTTTTSVDSDVLSDDVQISSNSSSPAMMTNDYYSSIPMVKKSQITQPSVDVASSLSSDISSSRVTSTRDISTVMESGINIPSLPIGTLCLICNFDDTSVMSSYNGIKCVVLRYNLTDHGPSYTIQMKKTTKKSDISSNPEIFDVWPFNLDPLDLNLRRRMKKQKPMSKANQPSNAMNGSLDSSSLSFDGTLSESYSDMNEQLKERKKESDAGGRSRHSIVLYQVVLDAMREMRAVDLESGMTANDIRDEIVRRTGIRLSGLNHWTNLHLFLINNCQRYLTHGLVERSERYEPKKSLSMTEFSNERKSSKEIRRSVQRVYYLKKGEHDTKQSLKNSRDFISRAQQRRLQTIRDDEHLAEIILNVLYDEHYKKAGKSIHGSVSVCMKYGDLLEILVNHTRNYYEFLSTKKVKSLSNLMLSEEYNHPEHRSVLAQQIQLIQVSTDFYVIHSGDSDRKKITDRLFHELDDQYRAMFSYESSFQRHSISADGSDGMTERMSKVQKWSNVECLLWLFQKVSTPVGYLNAFELRGLNGLSLWALTERDLEETFGVGWLDYRVRLLRLLKERAYSRDS